LNTQSPPLGETPLFCPQRVFVPCHTSKRPGVRPRTRPVNPRPPNGKCLGSLCALSEQNHLAGESLGFLSILGSPARGGGRVCGSARGRHVSGRPVAGPQVSIHGHRLVLVFWN